MCAQPDRRTLAISVVIVAFLLVQLAVPLVALTGSRPGRFAWQMYSALPNVPHAWTVGADGTEQVVDVDALFAVRRAEIDYARVLRAGLCEATGAPAVKIQANDSEQPELIACR